MTNANVFTLGGMIILGLVLHAAIAHSIAGPAIPSAAAATSTSGHALIEVENIRAQAAKFQALTASGPATTLVLGDRTLLVTTDWKMSNGDTTLTNKYYEYKDGKLVQVPVVNSENRR